MKKNKITCIYIYVYTRTRIECLFTSFSLFRGILDTLNQTLHGKSRVLTRDVGLSTSGDLLLHAR